MAEGNILDLNKTISGSDARLKQQQNLYEQVRSDRNIYSKNLIEYQAEISEMKTKFKTMNNRIEQLKEEIMTKDHNLVKEHFEHHKVQREKDVLRNEVNKVKKQMTSSGQIISNQFSEITKLNKIINEAENERGRQRKELNSVAGESNLLGKQLTKRSLELKKNCFLTGVSIISCISCNFRTNRCGLCFPIFGDNEASRKFSSVLIYSRDMASEDASASIF